jgi:hypothetical protein
MRQLPSDRDLYDTQLERTLPLPAAGHEPNLNRVDMQRIETG